MNNVFANHPRPWRNRNSWIYDANGEVVCICTNNVCANSVVSMINSAADIIFVLNETNRIIDKIGENIDKESLNNISKSINNILKNIKVIPHITDDVNQKENDIQQLLIDAVYKDLHGDMEND